MSLGKRIRELRDAKGMTGTELGRMVDGVGRGTVSSWEHDVTRPELDKLPVLAKVLGTDVDTLLRESGAPTTSKKKPLSVKSNVRKPTKMQPDVPNKEDAGGLLPLISWEQALVWGTNMSAAVAVKEKLPYAGKHSATAFWLEVVGDSMYAPNGEVSFREGDRIAVDPQRKPAHRDFVLVSLGGDVLMLRQLVVESGKRFLKAIAPGWPDALLVLRDGDPIVGTVIELAPKTHKF